MSIDKQNNVIFEPITLDQKYRFELPDNTREIFVYIKKTVTLNGLLYEKAENKYLMLYFQGNAKNLQNFLDNHSMVLDWGYNVLVTDYAGFGKSTGTMRGQSQMYADAEKVFDYAVALGYKPENIILYGYSMGTSMASHLAVANKCKALVLESPFSSIPEIDWVGNKCPSYELNTAKKAEQIDIPTLIIHGTADKAITKDHSQRIFEKIRTDQKKLTLIERGGHGDLRKRPEYKTLITEFISQY